MLLKFMKWNEEYFDYLYNQRTDTKFGSVLKYVLWYMILYIGVSSNICDDI